MYQCDFKFSISNDKQLVSVTDHNQFKDNRHAFKCVNFLTSTLCYSWGKKYCLLYNKQQ